MNIVAILIRGIKIDLVFRGRRNDSSLWWVPPPEISEPKSPKKGQPNFAVHPRRVPASALRILQVRTVGLSPMLAHGKDNEYINNDLIIGSTAL